MVGLTLYRWGHEMMCAGLWLDADSAVSVIVHVTVLRSRMETEFVKPSHLLYIWWQIDFLWSQCLGFGASYRCGRWMDVLSWEWVLEMNYWGGSLISALPGPLSCECVPVLWAFMPFCVKSQMLITDVCAEERRC